MRGGFAVCFVKVFKKGGVPAPQADSRETGIAPGRGGLSCFQPNCPMRRSPARRPLNGLFERRCPRRRRGHRSRLGVSPWRRGRARWRRRWGSPARLGRRRPEEKQDASDGHGNPV